MVQLLKDGAVTQEYAYDAYVYINADEFGIQAPFYGYNGEEQNPFTEEYQRKYKIKSIKNA